MSGCAARVRLMEWRQHRRYDLEARLSYVWRDNAGGLHQNQGLSRDISGGGVFVWTHDLPPPRADVEIDVFVSSILASSTLVIRGIGQVVRVEGAGDLQGREKERTGFAAAVKAFALRNEKGYVV